MEREFLAQKISRARADFRAILTEIFSRQTQGKKFSDERSGVKRKKERESSEIFNFFNSFESRKCEFREFRSINRRIVSEIVTDAEQT